MLIKDKDTLHKIVLRGDIPSDFYIPPIITVLRDLWEYQDVRLYLIDEALKVRHEYYKFIIQIISRKLSLLTKKEIFDVLDHIKNRRIFNHVFYLVKDRDTCIDDHSSLKVDIRSRYSCHLNWIEQFSIAMNYWHKSIKGVSYNEHILYTKNILSRYMGYMSPDQKCKARVLLNILNKPDMDSGIVGEAIYMFKHS